MSDKDTLRIEREELFTPEVDVAVGRRRSAERQRDAEQRSSDPPQVSTFRRVLNSPLLIKPLAGIVGALAVWFWIEPHFVDFPVVAGEVEYIGTDEFDVMAPGIVKFTVQNTEALAVAGATRLEDGVDGEPAFESLNHIQIGDRIEVAGAEGDGTRMEAMAIRPISAKRAKAVRKEMEDANMVYAFLLFPMTAVFIVLSLFIMEGLTVRNWSRVLQRSLAGTGIVAGFAILAEFVAAVFIGIGGVILVASLPDDTVYFSIRDAHPIGFLVFVACRSMAWAVIGAAMGVGMNLVRSTRAELRNSVLGGTMGGALGGLFFDPMDRFLADTSFFAASDMSRLVGLCAVGLSIGVFVAIGERLGREAWVRVRTGPLAGKSFILYRNPTHLGSSPNDDIYLFKDAGIEPTHAVIHKVGATYELERLAVDGELTVDGTAVTRLRLSSGHQIMLGNTVLEFEERAKRRSLSDTPTNSNAMAL